MYNLYIVDKETRQKVTLASTVPERNLDTRMMTILSRINDNYFVDDVLVGSKEDLNYQELLKV